jgi:uncharacterized protein
MCSIARGKVSRSGRRLSSHGRCEDAAIRPQLLLQSCILQGVTRYEWDAGNEPKVARHGLTRTECEAALEDPRRVVSDAYEVDGEVRLAIVGATPAGRIVRVVFTVRGGRFRVVTAYQASPSQRRQYPAPLAEPGIEEEPDD